MTSDEILTGIALIVGIALACQVVAPRLRLPALVLLLPAGFLAGVVFPQVNAEAMLGAAFPPLVNVAVALILFHGGLELYEAPMGRQDHALVQRLVWLGALITWVVAGLGAYWIIGLPIPIAALFGAIVIVSGPTVVGPLLHFVRPRARVRRIVAWEGTLIDPVGALIAVLVFQGVLAADGAHPREAVTEFAVGIGCGLLAAAVGVGIIWLGLRLAGDSRVLGTQVLLGAVVVAAGLADWLADDAGLVAGIAMGVAAPLFVKEGLAHVKPFFDTLVAISVGVLFVAISALVTPASLAPLVLPTLAVAAVLILGSRPAAVLLLTARSTLTLRERLFVGWMAPRGIVAASTASGFSAQLVAQGVPGGEALLPAVFVIIAATVATYGLTAVPVANVLGVRRVAVRA